MELIFLLYLRMARETHFHQKREDSICMTGGTAYNILAHLVQVYFSLSFLWKSKKYWIRAGGGLGSL